MAADPTPEAATETGLDGLSIAKTATADLVHRVLRASGSVTYRTSVDTATFSRAGPTVNVAVISSDQTVRTAARPRWPWWSTRRRWVGT